MVSGNGSSLGVHGRGENWSPAKGYTLAADTTIAFEYVHPNVVTMWN